jgi:hypothetical protein
MDILCHQLVRLGHPSNLCAIIETLVSHQKHCTILYRQALDPCLRHGARWRSAVPPALVTACRGHAPWTPWHTCLIPVLVHMFNPSPDVHISSHSSKLYSMEWHLLSHSLPGWHVYWIRLWRIRGHYTGDVPCQSQLIGGKALVLTTHVESVEIFSIMMTVKTIFYI